jgi:NTP pyrophosphatase (non-canonical NTP hydrolase)
MVRILVKPGAKIIETLTPDGAHMVHMVMGISGEAGELLDAVKKATIYKKSLDIENVVEELGDLEFYMEGLRQVLNITREQCLTGNIEKLSKRYADFKYTDQRAIDRADKQ